MLDLFGVLFEKFGPAVIGILTTVWTAIFIKSIVSAAMAAAAGAALQGGIKILGGKIMEYMGEAGGGADENEAEKSANAAKAIAGAAKDMVKSIGEIDPADIKKAGKVLLQMAIHLVKGMIAMALGMVAVSAVLSVVPIMALIKGVVGS